jgi:serine protease Do
MLTLKAAAGSAAMMAMVLIPLGFAAGRPLHAQSTVHVAPALTQVFGGGTSSIGISIHDVEDTDVKASKLPSERGVVVNDVDEDSPASKAGIKRGDVIVEFDGEKVRSVRQFMRLVQDTPSGRHVSLVVMRDGQRSTLEVAPRSGSSSFRLFDQNIDVPYFRSLPAVPKPPAPPAAPKAPAMVAPAPFESYIFRSSTQLGMSVEELSSQLAEYFGTKDGVLVSSVTDGSVAAKAGVKAGDIITSFDNSAVTSTADLRRRVQRLQPGDEFTVGIMRDKKSMTLKGKVEQERDRRWTYQS